MRTRSSAWHIAHLVEAVHALGGQESVKRSLAPQLTHEHWKVRSTVFGAALGAAPPLAGLGAGGGRSEDGPGAAALGGGGGGVAADGAALDALNDEIVVELQERGVAVPSTTRIRGVLAIRINLTNHRTRFEDLDLLVEQLCKIGGELAERRGWA
mmetsp:Transcript_39402/g.118998  ORF Transcript_39402/g.118998 Transcript_39402/m.118998 type:complete len:155 (-) Transcript_39402:49-513(-)